MDITVATSLCRWGRDAAALLLWGGALYVAVLLPPDLRRALAPGWVPWRRAAALVLALSLGALLPVEAAALGSGWPDAFDPATLRALLFDTTIGTAWMAQAAAAGLLLGTGLLPPRWRDRATVLVSGLLLAALTLSGHAAGREGWSGAVRRGCQVLHLLAGGFWFGALLPLLPTLRALTRPDLSREAVIALRRFSRAGHAAVALVVATGIGNTALIVGGWPGDWRSPYQSLLAGKVVLVVAMAALAVLNRYVYVPRLSRNDAAVLLWIRRATLAEIVLGVAVIALVAVFGLLDPE